MKAIRVTEKTQLNKEDFVSGLSSEEAKDLLEKLWQFIKMDSDGRVLYRGEEGGHFPGSTLSELIEYTTAKDRKDIPRPMDVERFWDLLAANNVTIDKVIRKMWVKMSP